MNICRGGWLVALGGLLAYATTAAIGASPSLAETHQAACTVSFDSARKNVCSGAVELAEPRLAGLADSSRFDASPIRVIKFDGPVGRSQRTALEARGIEILDYVPYHAYLVRIPSSVAPAAGSAGVEGVLWDGPYLPVWKVGLNLARELDDGRILEQADHIDSLHVSLHQGEPIEPVRAWLESLPGTDLRAHGQGFGSAFLILGFERAHLAAVVDAVATHEAVSAVDFHWPPQFMNSQAGWLHQSGQGDPPQWPLFEQGIFGCGQTIGIFDSGLHVEHCAFSDPGTEFPFDNCGQGSACEALAPTEAHRKIAAYYKLSGLPGGPSDDFFHPGAPSLGHGTFGVGNALGNNPEDAVDCADHTTPGGLTDLDGTAPGARVVMQEVGAGFQYLSLGGSLYHAAGIAYDSGARMHNNSWGAGCRNIVGGCVAGCQVPYYEHSRQADALVWENPDLLIFAAAGNSGGGAGDIGCGPGADVGTPGNAKNVFSIGGTRRGVFGDDVAGFSSRGPTSDRRTKPDLLAQSAGNVSASKTACGATNASGTSFGAPTAAGLSALVREYLQRGFYPSGTEITAHAIPTPSAALVKAIMINGAVEVSGQGAGGSAPNRDQGWGRILLDRALYFEGDARRLWLHDQTTGLQTAEIDVHQVVAGVGEALSITLAWHDFPAAQNAHPHLVNLLRLEVETPDGAVWTQKLDPAGELADSDPYQATTAGDYDDRNTVHRITLDTVEVAGVYEIRVRAVQVAMGDRQPYALAVTGNLLGLDTPEFVMQPAPLEVTGCSDQPAVFDLGVLGIGGFDDPVTLTADGLPAGADAAFSVNPVIPDDPAPVSTLTVAHPDGIAAGSHAFGVTGTSAGPGFDPATADAGLTLHVHAPIPAAEPLTPADHALDVAVRPVLTWAGVEGETYRVQVAADATFETLLVDQLIDTQAFHFDQPLAMDSTYFWRLRGVNACNGNPWSVAFRFTTTLEPVANVVPEELRFAVRRGGSDQATLEIGNAGTGHLVWQMVTDAITESLGNRTTVEESLVLPEFTLAPLLAGGAAATFTRPAGLANRGAVRGFSFSGTATGVSDSSSRASDTCMRIIGPDGSAYVLGGTLGAATGCGANAWDFQGAASAQDGAYESVHIPVFDPPAHDVGDWELSFVNDWSGTAAGPITWSEVVVTLHKQAWPFCDDPQAAGWLSVDTASGAVAAGAVDALVVTVDSAGLAGGSHFAALCIATNDADQPMVVVPVILELELDTGIFADRFEAP